MTAAELRAAVTDALLSIPAGPDVFYEVHDTPVDALEPPAYIVEWGPDPWRYIDTSCTDTAQLEVIAVGGRLTPEGAYPIVEAMVDAACVALMAARLRPFQVLTPAPFEIAQITYLAARLQIRRPIDIGGS